MKVKSMSARFSNIVNIGRNTFFITLGSDGIDINLTDVLNKAVFFSFVSFKNISKEDHKEIVLFIKKYLDMNKNGIIEINCDLDFVPPSGIYNKVIYNAFVDLNKYIEPRIIKWFRDADAKFIFTFDKENDIDINDVQKFVTKHELKKHNVYIKLIEFIEKEKLSILAAGYNVTLDLSDILGG